MSTHIIHFTTGLNPQSAEGLRNACLKALKQGATELRIHFSCEGGPTVHAFMLYNFLRSVSVPLTIHNIGKVGSMGLIVFLAGGHRLCNPYSSFLIHPLHWDFGQGRVDYPRLVEYSARLKDDVERYAQIFDEATDGAEEAMDVRAHLTSSHRLVSGDQAVGCGIVDEVAGAKLPADAVLSWVTAKGAVESSESGSESGEDSSG